MENLTKSSNFRIDIPGAEKSLATFQWQIQTATIPAVSMEVASVTRGSKYSKLANNNIAGTGTSYSDLVITFLMDENFLSYAELYQWLLTMNNPVNHGDNPDGKTSNTLLLHVLDNNKEHIVASFRYINPFPKELGEVSFNYTEAGDVDSVTCDVTFEYAYFEMIVDGKTLTPYE